jgi:hypothetical protein
MLWFIGGIMSDPEDTLLDGLESLLSGLFDILGDIAKSIPNKDEENEE